MKKFKAVLFTVILTALCLCFFAGCSPYNAVLDSHANRWIDNEFLENNPVYGIYRLNENFDPNLPVSETNRRYITDTTSPKDRIYIITEEENFKEIFPKYEDAIDFENELVICYIFADKHGVRDYYIDSISLTDKKLSIHYVIQKSGYNSALDNVAKTGSRSFMLKMDKIEFSEVEFIEVD